MHLLEIKTTIMAWHLAAACSFGLCQRPDDPAPDWPRRLPLQVTLAEESRQRMLAAAGREVVPVLNKCYKDEKKRIRKMASCVEIYVHCRL